MLDVALLGVPLVFGIERPFSRCQACTGSEMDPSVGTSHTSVLKSPVRHKDRRLFVSSGQTSTCLVLLMHGIDYQVLFK